MASLLLDPWSADYEGSVQTDGSDDAGGDVDPAVETPVWQAIVPAKAATDRKMYFIDGVRRLEARVLAQDDDGALIHGLFASTGAGCVAVENGAAAFECLEVKRFLILARGRQKDLQINAGSQNLLFAGVANAGEGPDELMNCLQNLMRTNEAELAESLMGPGSCVFADGPLSYFSSVSHALVGVIKRIFLPYLDAKRFALVSELVTGSRTPIFSIVDGKYDRYAWFQRLAGHRPMEHRLAGIVRLEVRAGLGLEHAKDLANFAAAVLPRFASSSVRDGRAPQNLVPVGALEDRLRHRLGDAVMIRRAIERCIFEGVTV